MMNPDKAEKIASAIIRRLFPSSFYWVEVGGKWYERFDEDLEAQLPYIVDLLTGEESIPEEGD